MKKLKHKNVKTTVGAILVKNGKLLLEKRNIAPFKGKWCLPGGHIEIGETAEEAVKREVKEETGLKIKNLKFLFYQDEFIPRLKWHAVALIFESVSVGKEKNSEEVSELRWFPFSEIKKLNIAFKNKEVIEKYLKMKNEN